ncbi:Arylmalonate decarboxylase [Symbiodinium microadriaticum]|uniref:Arylmalonate decarboxylase n=1 Tax=Symbiodinium microadriaticum TaxID=2951 RepID=A0A1Q9ECZ2_SYMMI|nr:Arylmalonate decarboxylase [Symbiodinium microadriaticum]
MAHDAERCLPALRMSAPRATIVAVQIPTDTVLDREGPLLVHNFPGVVLRMQKLEFSSEAITEETFEAAAQQIRKAAETLLPHDFHSIGLSCTSMSFVLGPERVDAQLGPVCPKAAVTDMSRAQVAALRAVGATSLTLVTPYIREVARKNVEMLEKAGFRVVSHATMGLTHDAQTDKVSKESIKAWAAAIDSEEADVIVIGCSALRACEPGFIDDLESSFRKPVVTSTQAFLWSLLRLAGIDDKISGYGALTLASSPFSKRSPNTPGQASAGQASEEGDEVAAAAAVAATSPLPSQGMAVGDLG